MEELLLGDALFFIAALPKLYGRGHLPVRDGRRCSWFSCREGQTMGQARKGTAAAIALTTAAFFAQAQMGGGMRRQKEPTGRGAELDKPALPVSATEQLTTRLYDLRMRLLITPAQSTAWESFYARCMDRARSAAVPVAAEVSPALQAVQQQLAMERSRVALTEGLYAATQNLYEVLAPEQQRTADLWLPQLLGPVASERPQKVWARDGGR